MCLESLHLLATVSVRQARLVPIAGLLARAQVRDHLSTARFIFARIAGLIFSRHTMEGTHGVHRRRRIGRAWPLGDLAAFLTGRGAVEK